MFTDDSLDILVISARRGVSELELLLVSENWEHLDPVSSTMIGILRSAVSLLDLKLPGLDLDNDDLLGGKAGAGRSDVLRFI